MFLLHFMYYMRDLDGYTLCQLSWNISYKMEKEFSMAGELPDLNQYIYIYIYIYISYILKYILKYKRVKYQNTKLKTHFY